MFGRLPDYPSSCSRIPPLGCVVSSRAHRAVSSDSCTRTMHPKWILVSLHVPRNYLGLVASNDAQTSTVAMRYVRRLRQKEPCAACRAGFYSPIADAVASALHRAIFLIEINADVAQSGPRSLQAPSVAQEAQMISVTISNYHMLNSNFHKNHK